MAIAANLAGQAVCQLETIGRRTGQPRPIEIWFAADPERNRIYILAGGRESSHWVRNVQANPAVRVRIAGRWFSGSATNIEGQPDEVPARHLVGAKYGYWKAGTELRGWARDSLAVAIDLEGPTNAA
ncbi:MAG: nitroreductase/quinone reductase family protein [Chloroflexota bacterium]